MFGLFHCKDMLRKLFLCVYVFTGLRQNSEESNTAAGAFRDHSPILQKNLMKLHPRKQTMKPKNEGVEDPFPFQMGDFQVLCFLGSRLLTIEFFLLEFNTDEANRIFSLLLVVARFLPQSWKWKRSLQHKFPFKRSNCPFPMIMGEKGNLPISVCNLPDG